MKCKAKTRNGERCQAAGGADGFCFTHSPARGAERAAARKLGGVHRRIPKVADPESVKTPIRDVPGVLAILDVATLDTLALDNGTQRTRALVGIAMAYLKAFEVGELESRLEAIEKALQERTKHD